MNVKGASEHTHRIDGRDADRTRCGLDVGPADRHGDTPLHPLRTTIDEAVTCSACRALSTASIVDAVERAERAERG